LKERSVRQVAVESTGVYRIPVWNVLDAIFELTLVNPEITNEMSRHGR
jgi:hypothetical protein